MKHICFAALFVLAGVASVVQAQDIFDVSLRGGVTMCQIDGDNSGPYNKLGYQAGINSTFTVGGNWRMMVEFNLTNKGSYVNKIDRTISLTYVEVPMMLTYGFNEGRLRLGAGIAPGILAKAHVSTSGEYEPTQSRNYRRFDALPVCAELSYRWSDHMAVFCRYSRSMVNIAKSQSGTYVLVYGNSGQFNRFITAGFSYTL